MHTHPRSKEIVAWLQAHPNVQQFVVIDDDVIDDDDDCLDVLPLFQPSGAVGLTDKLAKAAADYLKGHTDKDMRLVRTFQKVIAYLKRHTV